jgi:multidrug efflux pump subunit AcrA (membrane-fusion protein)
VLSRFSTAATIAVATTALGAASCSSSTSGIAVGVAARADVVEVVDASASVTARTVATLSAPADGTLTTLYVAPGTSVTVGQLLAVIDSPTAQQRLADAERTLASLRAGGTSVGRTNNLSGEARQTDEAAAKAFTAARGTANKITDSQLRTALLTQVDAGERAYHQAAAAARAQITSVQLGVASVGQAVNALTAAQRTQAEAAYALAKSTVDALTLRAPVAGIVQLGGPAGGVRAPDLRGLSGAVGNLSGAGAAGDTSTGAATSGPGIDPAPPVGAQVPAGTPVLTVVDVGELGLLADVDEADVLLVKPDMTAAVDLDAAPGARYTATVRSVDVLPSTSTRGGVSFRVRLALGAGTLGDGNPAPVPLPGMSAVAHLQVRSATAAVVVPARAVFTVDGHDAVWMVRAGKAQRVAVTVGVAGHDRVQIVAGVGEGDRVVVRGADQLRSGQQLP